MKMSKKEGLKLQLIQINKNKVSPSASQEKGEETKSFPIKNENQKIDAMEGTEGTQQPHLVLANKLFLLTHSDVDDIEKVRLRDEVMSTVVADGNHLHSIPIGSHRFFLNLR